MTDNLLTDFCRDFENCAWSFVFTITFGWSADTSRAVEVHMCYSALVYLNKIVNPVQVCVLQ